MKKAPSETKPIYKKPGFYASLIFWSAILALVILAASILSLRWINPPATSFTLRYNWSSSDIDRYNLRDWWVSSNEIPEHLKWAVIASEDQLFWEHNGFDIESIKDAWNQRLTGERIRGASTISQQVAKNLYLSPAQSFVRKGVEAGITILIELFLSKDRILEIYLNIAEFGPGIYGVGLASEEYWGLKAGNLTPDMSARLAAVLPSPSRMRVEPPSPFTEERSQWILRQMTNLSGIPYVQVDTKSRQPNQETDPLLREAEHEIEKELFQLPDTVPVPAEQDLPYPDSVNMEQPGLPDSLHNQPDST